MSPLSNAFLRDHQLSSMESFYPLRVYICDGCRLVQLPETARAEAIFDQDYIYQPRFRSTLARRRARVSLQLEDDGGVGETAE